METFLPHCVKGIIFLGVVVHRHIYLDVAKVILSGEGEGGVGEVFRINISFCGNPVTIRVQRIVGSRPSFLSRRRQD